MNPLLARLRPYPFERLRSLLRDAQPPRELLHISMSIGEPRHAPPQWVLEEYGKNLATLGQYPATLGLPQFRAAAAMWLTRRFALPSGAVNPDSMVLPVNGTREALFAFVQAAIDATRPSAVVMPNPFYQIYEGAALLAGAEPHFMENAKEDGSDDRCLPDLESVPAHIWQRCQLLFLCSPGNPTGAAASLPYLRRAIELAERYDFVVASDECYSEIYFDEGHPPPGLLQAALSAGHDAFQRCIVFHSLSKRSSVPGLRSGFVAGDPALIEPFLLYRTYHGCAMPMHTQLASIPLWQDDQHVVENRRLYRDKFAAVLPVLREAIDIARPAAGFYLWPRVGEDERFARELFERKHVTVLPGSYIARETAHGNPGAGRIRISLVADLPACVQAAGRIRDYASGK